MGDSSKGHLGNLGIPYYMGKREMNRVERERDIHTSNPYPMRAWIKVNLSQEERRKEETRYRAHIGGFPSLLLHRINLLI